MEKLIKDGMVAVVYSRGFGAGWATWNREHKATLCMDKRIAELVADGKATEAVAVARGLCPDIYDGGGDSLVIEWVPEGTAFRIDEYDGAESVITTNDFDLMA